MTPDISLAFAVQSNPGVYAVLLGSGVSRAAQIPTGWEVVVDLIRKVARAQGANCEPDPAVWYEQQYKTRPGYSQLLDGLAKTSSERQQILRSYFEPTEEERQQGIKTPTRAHRAIASLVASGHVRLVLTTNFDRLMERALDEAGAAPTVISNADQIAGAAPLAHVRNCVVKLHGDYLDTRILNTPEELSEYDPRLDDFLDRVIDEFGLIVCGWSAEWDVALRNAIDRAPNRRYTTFFAARGGLGERASALLARRHGTHVPIADADTFFETLQARIEAIDEYSHPHPVSVAAAVSSCKRFLSEPQVSRIRLADLVAGEARRVSAELTSARLFNTSEEINTTSVTSRIRHYDGLCQTLAALAFEIGRWGDREAIERVADAQRRMYATRANQGLTAWIAFQNYPVALVTFAGMLGASFGDRCEQLRPLLANDLEASGRHRKLAVEAVPPFCFLEEDLRWGNLLEGKSKRHAPLNEWISEVLWSLLSKEFVSKTDFDLKFDWVEIVLAMANHKLQPPIFNKNFHPPGCYGYRHANRDRVVDQMKHSLDSQGNGSPYVLCGLFGSGTGECQEAIDAFQGYAAKLRSNWWS